MKRIPNCKIFCLVLLLIISPISISGSNEADSPYQYLICRLIEDGFETEFLANIFMDSRAEPDPDRMVIYFDSRETKELYEQFFTPESISLARNFLRENIKILRKAEERFHVEKEVVVAILLVESRFGENIGKYRVIPTLARMALMRSPEYLSKIYMILREREPELSYEWVDALAKRRAEWAYKELRCFLKIIRHESIDPLEVYGSYAGALGMAQFIPSSYLNYALSKKGLGNWLLNKEEAIFSIGNYLKSHGWKRGLSMEKKKNVLWSYNHSHPYGEAILKIAQKIKSNPPHRTKSSKQLKGKAVEGIE